MPVYTYKHNDQTYNVSGENSGHALDFLARTLDVDRHLIMLQYFAIPVIVVAINSAGEPELLRYDIQVTRDQYKNGDHYEMAKDQAAEDEYDPKAAFDYHDPAYKSMVAYRDEYTTPEIIPNA